MPAMETCADHVLIVDDDPNFSDIAGLKLKQMGYASTHAGDFETAVDALGRHQPLAILLDYQLGDQNGLRLIGPLNQHCDGIPIIMVTRHHTVELVVEAIHCGAFDFLPKPLDEARLLAVMSKVKEYCQLRRRVAELETGTPNHDNRLGRMIGQSPAMQTIYHIIRNVAQTDASVMIVGESGTGKELVAEAIHDLSSRSGKPMVALNMAALPRDLVESTLFGHERGAFTGAEKLRIGACEEADGGTLFLDEICEMPLDLQPKLLRFLQEGVLRRVGADKDTQSDVRIICATNRDPLTEVRQGRMRADLYYRLNVVPIQLPPLRERHGDVSLLAMHGLTEYTRRYGKRFERICQSVLQRLNEYHWPGNVRQLLHAIERIVVLNNGLEVTHAMIPPDLLIDESATDPPVPTVESQAPADQVQQPVTRPSSEASSPAIIPMVELERRAIASALAHFNGSASQAARELGISEATIYRKIKQYDLKDVGR